MFPKTSVYFLHHNNVNRKRSLGIFVNASMSFFSNKRSELKPWARSHSIVIQIRLIRIKMSSMSAHRVNHENAEHSGIKHHLVDDACN